MALYGVKDNKSLYPVNRYILLGAPEEEVDQVEWSGLEEPIKDGNQYLIIITARIYIDVEESGTEYQMFTPRIILQQESGAGSQIFRGNTFYVRKENHNKEYYRQDTFFVDLKYSGGGEGKEYTKIIYDLDSNYLAGTGISECHIIKLS